MKNYRVYVPKHGESPDQDAYEVDAFCPEDAAQEACEHYWSDNDGWEWLARGDAVLAVIDPEGTETQHRIHVDYEPMFYAEKISEESVDESEHSA